MPTKQGNTWRADDGRVLFEGSEWDMLAELTRLRAGYHWLEQLLDGVEGQAITMIMNESDGEIEISHKGHSLHRHIDLADLCMEQATVAGGEVSK